MCKIIGITNTRKINNMRDFSQAMAEIMADMRDGFGYACVSDDGAYGTRTLDPTGYALGTKNIPVFCASPEVNFGDSSSNNAGGAIFHGRISTNSISLINTHPISKDNWHLIHNGVVTDHGAKYPRLTSNDSEHVLKHLMRDGISSIAKNLTGYYAGMALDPNGYLHIFRDKIANLFWAYSEVLQSDIFATTKEIIEEIGEYINEELSSLKVNDDTYLIYSPSGDLLHHEVFNSRGFDRASALMSEKSLGRKLDAESLSDGYDDSYYGPSYNSLTDDILEESELGDGEWTDEELEIYNERLSKLKLA